MKRGLLFDAVSRWIRRQGSSETILLALVSVFVGLSSAAGVWAFKRLIELFQRLAFGYFAPLLAPLGRWTLVVPTVLGGLIVGWIVLRLVGPERHHGVAGIMEAEALGGGRLPYRRMPAKALASALSIAVGASVGPEDPSVQIGANLGSLLAQTLHLSEERARAIVAAGAAGGIAAAFNAPIAAVFFAMEIILGEFTASILSVVVLSSVISAAFTQAVSGSEPAFHVPVYTLNSAWDFPLYLVLGLLSGLVSALYIRTLDAARSSFARLSLAAWVKPAIAGLIVGLTGLALPQVLGIGYETITLIFSGVTFPVMLLLALLFAKLVLTPVSLGGGFQGGVFAPSLYLGAVLGAAFGLFARAAFPALNINPPAFAMVGMGAVLAGAVRAPLTAILLLFEMTNDYRIILPLMFAVVISMLFSEKLERESVYSLSLLRKGIRLDKGRDVEVLEGMTVSEVMSRQPVTLRDSDTLSRALEQFTSTHSHGFAVLDDHSTLVGIFSIQDLERAQAAGNDLETTTVGDVCTRSLVVCYPDETLASAMRRMSITNVGRMPVVERGDPAHMIGLLRRSDIISAYEIALTRRAARRHQIQSVRLNLLSRLPVEEARVAPGSPAANCAISEVPWPPDVIIASLRRSGQIIVPHGSTRIQPGDTVVFVSQNNRSIEDVKAICTQKTPGE